MYNNRQNDGIHINAIILSTTCAVHNADKGTSCWDVYIPSIRDTLPAICNKRVRRAGFVGKISPSSLRRGGGKNSRTNNTKVRTK